MNSSITVSIINCSERISNASIAICGMEDGINRGIRARAAKSGDRDEIHTQTRMTQMHWIAATAKDTASALLEKRLWDAADQFRANSGLKAQEYSGPILGLIFLRFAEVRFAANAAGSLQT